MFDIRRQDSVTIVEAMGPRIDMETSAVFKATLDRLIAAGPYE